VPQVQAQQGRHPGRRHDGRGIAYAQASRGIATVLKDVSQDKAEAGKAYSARSPRPASTKAA
jgi:3-hydroxyacyl-CoA dehydrogenase